MFRNVCKACVVYCEYSRMYEQNTIHQNNVYVYIRYACKTRSFCVHIKLNVLCIYHTLFLAYENKPVMLLRKFYLMRKVGNYLELKCFKHACIILLSIAEVGISYTYLCFSF